MMWKEDDLGILSTVAVMCGGGCCVGVARLGSVVVDSGDVSSWCCVVAVVSIVYSS